MHPTTELVAAVQRDRERDAERLRLARFAACARACCSTSAVSRFRRALRLQPETC